MQTATHQNKSKKKLFTTQFILLCLSNFFFSASFQMLLPELPNYLTKLGGAEYKGYILALFTLTAGISRPFSGKLTDTIGRVPIMVFGSLVCVLCSALYPILTTVFGFLMLRLVHGFSTGFKPTATAAYVADVVEMERRGEGMSYIGISAGIGTSLAPMIGSEITNWFGINALFAISVLFAFLSVVVLVRHIDETLVEKKPFSLNLFKINRQEIFEPNALPTFITQFLLSFAYGTFLCLTPDLCESIGLKNKGLFLGLSAGAALVVRLIFSKTSDQKGRVYVLKWSAVAQVVALLIIAFNHSSLSFISSSIIFGMAWGMNMPTLQAWAVDLSPSENRGRGLATMFIALEFGIGMGSVVAQVLYKNNMEQMFYAFMFAAALSFFAFMYLSKQKN